MDGHELKRTLAVHETIARAYADERFPPCRGGLGADLRMFTITSLWVLGIERPPPGERWNRICQILHLEGRRFWWTIEQDVPRWEPPQNPAVMGACEAPMIRRPGECGQRSCTSFRVTDPTDGTWRMAAFCRRHWDYSREVHRAEMARVKGGGLPEPVPNTGGLLPCYLNWKWLDAYRTARPGWKPPAVGICADDWPVMAKVTTMEPPKLSVIEGEAAPLPSGEHSAPSLRLVPRPGAGA